MPPSQPQKITINGQVYDHWSQVPPELREALAGLPDADRNGIPDLFEGNLGGLVEPGQLNGHQTFTTTTSVEVNGQHYDSMDQVPQSVRDLLGQALSGSSAPTAQLTGAPAAEPTAQAPPPQQSGQPADQIELNGERFTVEQAAGEREKKGFLRRLFGGAERPG